MYGQLKEAFQKGFEKASAAALKAETGSKAQDNSWQAPFPKKNKCPFCGGEAGLMVSVKEKPTIGNGKPFVAHMHKDVRESEYWPHDAIAAAVYLCKKCGKSSSEWNQA